MLSEKISAIPRVDNGGPPRQGGWQEKRPFGGGLRRSNLEGRRGWRAKLLRAGKKGLREAREYGYNFYSWVSLTREIICSEEIKTKMQSKWPAVTQGNPEVQIIPLRAFYSTWLSAHKVWRAAFVILLSAWAPGLGRAVPSGVWGDHRRPLRSLLSLQETERMSPLGDSCRKLWYFDFEGLLYSTILRNKCLIFHRNNTENIWEKIKGDP